MPIYDPDTTRKFWKKVNKLGPLLPGMRTRCWQWTGYVNKVTGYGCFGTNRWRLGAHQFAWRLRHGVMPAGLEVLHECDNRVCVRHLRSGTRLDNMRDAVARGRTRTGKLWQGSHDGTVPRGSAHYAAKLDDADIVSIKRLCARGVAQKAVAKRYGVNPCQVSRIVNNKRRAYLGSDL